MPSRAKHIIWIVVDSMRSYKTAKDDRDYLDVMNDIAKYSTEFTNVITSAPTSVMSIAAMMSSIPAYYIGLNYLDFKYNQDVFPSFPLIWEKAGGIFRSFLNARETRDVFYRLLNPVGKKYYPKGLSDAKKRWDNEEVTAVLKNYLENNTFEKPTCFFIWFNIRLDPRTSSHVTQTINLFKVHALFDESVFLITSDHGYLDPIRGYTPQKLKELGLTHDILVTEDQIRVPLCISYPGVPVQKIQSMVSTLDIMPTLLEYFGLTYPADSMLKAYGNSWLRLIHKEIQEYREKFIRVDGRFMFQSGRVTAIRHGPHKYVYYHDSKNEQFFDISTDFFEEKDLSPGLSHNGLQVIFQRMKDYFQHTEREAEDIIVKIILEKFKNKVLAKIDPNKIDSVAIVRMCDPKYFSFFEQMCTKVFLCHIDKLEIEHFPKNSSKYNLLIAITDHNYKERKEQLLRTINQLNAPRVLMLDINMDAITNPRKMDLSIFRKWIFRELKMFSKSPSRVLGYPRKIRSLYRSFMNT